MMVAIGDFHATQRASSDAERSGREAMPALRWNPARRIPLKEALIPEAGDPTVEADGDGVGHAMASRVLLGSHCFLPLKFFV